MGKYAVENVVFRDDNTVLHGCLLDKTDSDEFLRICELNGVESSAVIEAFCKSIISGKLKIAIPHVADDNFGKY